MRSGCLHAEEQNPSRAHVVSMWVDPAHRRAGVGAELINALGIWAKTRGLRELKLMLTGVNRNAIEFYKRVGFRMTGKMALYPNDPSIKEYVMLLPLQP